METNGEGEREEEQQHDVQSLQKCDEENKRRCCRIKNKET